MPDAQDSQLLRTPEGLVVVDKPSGWTSHDVVGKIRRLAGTRKVGHAGTLDPMATGVLVCGVGRATRLLGHLAGHDKTYEATIRLGQSTVTDDAEGEPVATASTVGTTEADVLAAAAEFVGTQEQVPSAVSAVKVDGRRAYARVRSGESVELKPRVVTIAELSVKGMRRPSADLLDVDVQVTCSSGTYIRAIARDLGKRLEVGGHLTALRRTRVGDIDLSMASTIEQLEASLDMLPLADAVRRAFPALVASDEEAEDVRHGRPIALDDKQRDEQGDEQGDEQSDEPGLVGVFDRSGNVLALMEPRDGMLRVVAGFAGGT
ncbi:MAG TPA: tRNA pseudouridine(55) synthase TruB [Actinomycetes bacterium]|nr:tRNA pseudouridine(55) synthase TruB [Actinomycetes bacterium]